MWAVVIFPFNEVVGISLDGNIHWKGCQTSFYTFAIQGVK